MRTGTRIVAAAVAVALLSGCSGGSSDPDRATAKDAWGDPPAAAPAAKIGAPGTACPLPITFDVAGEWSPEAVEDGLFDQGGFALRCEIDAKPAGHLGFLRVWTGHGTDPAAALEAFVKAEQGTAAITGRRTRSGPASAETTYLDVENDRPERVLAFSTGPDIVILTLGGADTEEHEDMLPAYVLARDTMA
ncbi:lipoprotein [Actinoplanes sp. NPDC000266]